MMNDPPLVMTVEEVAAYLRIPRSSVYKLAQESRIPCKKAGRRWRFHRDAIDQWLANIHQTHQQESTQSMGDILSLE